jgi:polyferredoxin
MRIVTVRRISQVFFLLMLFWFAAVTAVGDQWWRRRAWPINWLLELDPLAAIGTVLTTGRLYAGLAWAAATIVLTILLGRFFCGWVCPFGTMHQFVGWLGRRARPLEQRVKANRYRRGQSAKYYILAGLLAMAVIRPASLQTGLLDPIPLAYRSVNLGVLAVAESAGLKLSPSQRWYELSWLIGGVFLAAVLLNLAVPRFYCRFVCPLGALLGVLNRWSIWRIGKKQAECVNCRLCEADCEGACSPASQIRTSECVLCMNCLEGCRDDLLSYQRPKSAAGEITPPDISRRGVLASLASGLLIVPLLRLGAKTGANWSWSVIRPPGAMEEEQFLRHCIKCGQCIRICPTNVLQPGGLEGGLESLWTPVLNNRIGSSACQLNCVACGGVCPTAAIRPISLDERLGRGEFAQAGAIRLGTAFVDRNRCLPWAMDRPCIVCQENCPVSPKAIFVRECFSTIRAGKLAVCGASGATMELNGASFKVGELATGDYYCKVRSEREAIVANGPSSITVARPWRQPPEAGSQVEIQVRLQQPYVDPRACVGCGICEHECPVSGLRAIRVTAENESRSRKRMLLP